MIIERFTFDTENGINIILRSGPPPNWDSQADEESAPTRLFDANGRSLDLGESVWLQARIENELSRLKLIIERRFDVDLIMSPALLNLHVVAVL